MASKKCEIPEQRITKQNAVKNSINVYIYIYIYDQFVDSSTNELSLRAYWYCSDQMKILKDQSDLQTDL